MADAIEDSYFGMFALSSVMKHIDLLLSKVPDNFEREISEYGSYNGFQIQNAILKYTVSKDCAQPPASYRYKFLKSFMNLVELKGWEIAEEVWCASSTACQESRYVFDGVCEFGWKSFFLQGPAFQPNRKRVTISFQPFVVSGGTTGLNTWDAAFFMVDFMYHRPELIQKRKILELGCGSGFTGICLLTLLEPETYMFSDCHGDVLINIHRNLEQNRFANHSAVDVVSLDWESATSEDLLKMSPEVILASDVAYSEEVILAFFRFLSLTKICSVVPLIYVALKIRSNETWRFFARTAEAANFDLVPQYVDVSQGVFRPEVYSTIDCVMYLVCHRNS